MNLLIDLLIGGLVIYLIYYILGMLAIPQPVKNIILIVVAIIAIIWLLGFLGTGLSLPR